MADILYISPNRVTMGSNRTGFDSNKSYLYRDTTIPIDFDTLLYTKTLEATTLRVYQEKLGNLTKDVTTERPLLSPETPTNGPFIQKYYTGTGYQYTDLVNILLIDKPPVRTGFFEFAIGEYKFPGLITRQTSYPHYDWQQVTGQNYDYVLQSNNLGYGIEISDNLLYTLRIVDGNYFKIPTDLLLFLQSLSGNEEIISLPTDINPETYVYPVIQDGGTIDYSSLPELPVDVYSLSDADALSYIASYPDLISSLGADPAAGRTHYNTIGFQEGRKITFNPISYLNNYTDLKETYLTDTYAATIHYITIGYGLGRTYSPISTVQQYGGLYDERFGSLPVYTDSLIWQINTSLDALYDVLTYKGGTTSFYVNGNLPIDTDFTYIRIQ